MTSARKPERWDVPFGLEMTDAAVDRVLSVAPFSRLDPERFPKTVPLRGVIAGDTRVVRYRRGDLVVREGDYGNSAFFVLEGGVRVVLSRGQPERAARGWGSGGEAPGNQENRLPPELLGRKTTRRKTLRQLLARLFRRRGAAEERDPERWTGDLGRRTTGPGRESVRVFLQDVPKILDRYRTARIEPGEFFGEIAALGRTPRTASVFAEEDSELLEIRWQGLRELRRSGPEIQSHVDRLYRENSLRVHLRETPLFRHLTPEELGQVAESVRFETFGDFDWYGTYRALAAAAPEERRAREPVIAEEGDYPNGVLLVRAGFARQSARMGEGARTLGYLGRGEVFGLAEIAHNWKAKEAVPLRSSLHALGYVDVLVVPTPVIEKVVLPRLPREAVPLVSRGFAPGPPPVDEGLLEFLVERRLINGSAAMVMDLERCVHCDACVEACAATHEGNPRFLRHGPRHGRWMVANACMHCADPVCMIGCPTGAIHRSDPGPVVINDATCIGCGTCAQSCPWDNIRMVDTRNRDGSWLVDEAGRPIVKATKCDLCVEEWGGPACARACPHDALVRIDLRDLGSLARWIDR